MASAQVPGCYLKAGTGYQPDSARGGSPGQSPLSFSHSRRLPLAPSRTSPLQPLQDPSQPPANQAAAAADSASSVGQVPGLPGLSDTASESTGQAILEQAHKDASSNGLQHGADLGMSGLSLQETGGEAARHSGQQLKATEVALSSTGDSVAEVQHMSHQHGGLHLAGGESRPEHPEEALAAAQLSSEPVTLEASSTGAEPAAAAGFAADLAASSAPAEPELVAVAERAEHAAAAVAAEGLELDRSSEPAAIAAARSGSLAPGDSSHDGRLA